MSIDERAEDVLERPEQRQSSKDERNAAASAVSQREGSDSSSFEETSSGRRSVSEVLKSYIRVGAANFGAHYRTASTIIGNRKARSSVAVPLVPQMLQVQNVTAVFIALCGSFVATNSKMTQDGISQHNKNL